jgi:hypothetical protein
MAWLGEYRAMPRDYGPAELPNERVASIGKYSMEIIAFNRAGRFTREK